MYYTNPYPVTCLDGNSSLLNCLTDKEKDILSQHYTQQTVKKGAYLFMEGDKPSGLICLCTGKIKLFKMGIGGREQILKLVKPEDIIGYSSIFNDQPWHVSAKAIEESTVCIFDMDVFMKILKKNAEFMCKILKAVSVEVGFLVNRTVSLTQKHVRGRIAESLLLLCDIYGFEEDGKTLGIAISREDIANLSNMTTSNAIRTLSNMASEGNIGLNGRKIQILEKANLQHMSQFG